MVMSVLTMSGCADGRLAGGFRGERCGTLASASSAGSLPGLEANRPAPGRHCPNW